MKLQLDTQNKTVKIEGTVNLEELFETLKRFLPKGEWKQFSLEANTTIEWVNPITVPYYPYYPLNPYPWWDSPYRITRAGVDYVDYQKSMEPPSGSDYSLKKGTFCIQTP